MLGQPSLLCSNKDHERAARRHPLHVSLQVMIWSIYPAAKQTSVRRMYFRPEVTGAASCSRQQSPWRCNSALPAFGAMLATILPRGPVQQIALSKRCVIELHSIILARQQIQSTGAWSLETCSTATSLQHRNGDWASVQATVYYGEDAAEAHLAGNCS